MQIESTFWTELSRVADLATLVAIVLAVVAVRLTMSQLSRTQKAEAAADRAREETKRESALRLLLATLPNLERIEGDLQIAVREDERPAVERGLADWRDRGSEVQGMLASRRDAPPTLVSDLARSIVQASMAIVRLGDQETEVGLATGQARLAIATVVGGLSDLKGRLETFVEEEEEEETEIE